ncbi:MAG: hypothetical protein M3Z00_00940 [Actinomycetota bacterium]|nr:hypothetical protein [Actinomycetota bacterium]
MPDPAFSTEVSTSRPGRLPRRPIGWCPIAALLIAAWLTILAATPAHAVPARPDTAAMAAAAAPLTPQQAVSSGAAYGAARGITERVAVIDRSSGKVLARTANADDQVASESIVKLLIAVYYRVRYGSGMSAGMAGALGRMIRCSDDSIASAYWTNGIVPAMAARYGLLHTTNNPGNPGHWGATHLTADDVARLLYRVGKDPAISSWLFPNMVAASARGCDGFNQNFGMNAIAGAGSKQGWGYDNWTGQPASIHSVGFTAKYVVAILQTGDASRYGAMPATATHTARLITSAVVPPVYPRYSKRWADRFTSSLYRTLLSRPISSPSQSVSLQRGTKGKRQVSAEISTSDERRHRLVNTVYLDCLGRTADRAGSARWSSRLARGNLRDVYAGLCASTESYNRSGRRVRAWAQQALKDIWKIHASPAQINFWANRAARSGLTAAVMQMTADAHFRRLWIDRTYLAMLGRHPDTLALGHVGDVMAARGAFSLPVMIAMSKEYWARRVA